MNIYKVIIPKVILKKIYRNNYQNRGKRVPLSGDDKDTLNDITREYRWVGSYKINGEKIVCNINSQTIELIMNPNNTICIPSETGECFVKQ